MFANARHVPPPSPNSGVREAVADGVNSSTSDRLQLLVGLALFGVLVMWAALASSDQSPFSRTPTGYYHFATEAVLDGRWHLSIAPRPELAELPDPYDPAQNLPYRVLDLSYYQGRYYFYWGMAPVVALFAPARALTGHYVSEALAAAIFGWVAFAAMSALLFAFRQRFAPQVGVIFLWTSLVLLAFGSLLSLLAWHNTVYGVPIASAAAGQAVAWWCIYRALTRPAAAIAWTIAAGFALGCALTSRPNYVFWIGVYALPLWVLLRRNPSRWARLFFAAALPPVVCVGAMLVANWARFGSFTEFGMRYQLTGPVQPEVLFSFSDLVRNLNVYAWNFPRFSRYFPFFTTPATGPFGVLTAFPAVFLALGIVRWRRQAIAWPIAGTIALAGVGGLLATCAFFGCGTRYMVDFLPACVLAASLGGLSFAQWAHERRRRWSARISTALVALSAAIALGLHFQNWDMLGRDLTGIARILNAPTFLWERWLSPPRGAVSITFQAPTDQPGSFQPLLSVGSPADGGEIVFAIYDSDRQLRIGFFQTGTTHWVSNPLPFDYGRSHTLFVALGSLMPPESHPVFRSWSPTDRRLSQRLVAIALNGELVYRTELDFRAARRVRPVVGENVVFAGVSETAFTGRIHQVQWHEISPHTVEEVIPSTQQQAAYGRWRLRVRFPENPTNTTMDPLLVSGSPGAADFVFAFYPQPGRVAFGHDAWGHGGSSSAVLSIDVQQEHVIEIAHGGLYWPRESPEWAKLTPERRDDLKNNLRIWLNGELVAEFRDLVHDAAPESVTPLENRIGGSSTAPRFSGTALSAERIPESALTP
ncbi:MAG TPA: hypothetical protein VHF69_11160 [Candidatus Synoicihabitans sp.]|nr:hypothetical protein [Candidatus Synoicihabitans sp.]